MPRLGQLDDLRLDRRADPRQLLRAAGDRELRDRRRRLAHPGRGPAIRDHAEPLLPEHLGDVRELVERVGDVAVARQRRHRPIIGLFAERELRRRKLLVVTTHASSPPTGRLRACP